MPKTAIDYSKTQIYKLIHNDDINNENIYIGSTTNFIIRKYQHKTCCNNEKAKNYNLKVYQTIRLIGGWTEWSMLLVENFPCIKKKESDVRERYWIDHFKSQLNMRIPSRTEKEWQIDNKSELSEKKKEYYNNNKETKTEYNKEYYQNNKAKLAEITKKYQNNNKEKITEKTKEYYKKNKEKIIEKAKEKVTCECGCIVTKSSIYYHKKSKNHLDLMLELNDNVKETINFVTELIKNRK